MWFSPSVPWRSWDQTRFWLWDRCWQRWATESCRTPTSPIQACWHIWAHWRAGLLRRWTLILKNLYLLQDLFSSTFIILVRLSLHHLLTCRSPLSPLIDDMRTRRRSQFSYFKKHINVLQLTVAITLNLTSTNPSSVFRINISVTLISWINIYTNVTICITFSVKRQTLLI